MKLVYSAPALRDLLRLREFIADENPDAARQVSAALIEGINKLCGFSLLGKTVLRAPNPEIVRDLILGKYVVRYLILSESITVLRVWH